MPSPRGVRAGALVLFFVSGATSLVYEVLWLRELILILGSTLFATSAVLSSFMGGLAAGSYAAGRLADRRAIVPLRIYGLLELGIGLCALVVPALFRGLTPFFAAVWNAGASDSFVGFSLAKVVGTLVVLLPPTFLMGASLPVLARQVADDPDRIGGSVGWLYAVNTFGAVAGTYVAGFVAVPVLGVRVTSWATAAVNVTIGIVAIVLSRGAEGPIRAAGSQAPPPAGTRRSRLALAVFAASGFVAMVLEIAWTRGLSLILGSSVYAFSLMLIAFLIGLAAGSAAVSGWIRRRPGVDLGAVLAFLLGAAGLLTYATSFLFQAMPRLFGEIYFRWGFSPDGWFAVQLLFGLAIMFPATFASGGIFPVVLQMVARDLDTVGGAVGKAYSANTVGTIAGSLLAGFVVIPLLGVRATLIAVAAALLGLGLVASIGLARGGRLGRRAIVAPLAAALLLVLLVRPAWNTVLMNSGVYINVVDLPAGATWEDFFRFAVQNTKLVFFREGLTSSVMVGEQPAANHNRFLSVNGKVEASTSGDMETQTLCAHLPLLLHPDPRDVLIVGLASGITAGSAASHPVRSIRVVEIEGAMVPAAKHFSAANGNVLEDPRLVVSINDARNELTYSDRSYDVIVSEPSNPWMTVASNLFTEEFFRLVRTRLRPGAIFCQWIQTYGLATDDLRSVVAAFRASFPEALLFETFEGTDLLLLGSDRPLRLDLDRITARMSELRVHMDLTRVGTRNPADLLPLLRLGAPEIQRFVAGAERNTDDNARVEFSAPRTLYEFTSGETLAKIAEIAVDPIDYVDPRPASRVEEDRLRLRLAKACLDRRQATRAKRIATELLKGPLDEEASKFLKDNRLI